MGRAAGLSRAFRTRLVGEHPDRFLTYGTLPLPHVEASLAEMPRMFDQLGMADVSLTTLAGGLSPQPP